MSEMCKAMEELRVESRKEMAVEMAQSLYEQGVSVEQIAKASKVDVDTEMELAVRFGVVSIPTLVVMEKGQITGKTVGYAPKAELMKLLNL